MWLRVLAHVQFTRLQCYTDFIWKKCIFGSESESDGIYDGFFFVIKLVDFDLAQEIEIMEGIDRTVDEHAGSGKHFVAIHSISKRKILRCFI